MWDQMYFIKINGLNDFYSKMYPVSKTKDLGILGVIGIVGASPSKIFFIENPKYICLLKYYINQDQHIIDRLFAQGYGTKTAQHWLEQLYLSPHR